MIYDNISDADLALCVNEYVRRVVTVVRRHEDLNKLSTYVEITCRQYGSDGPCKVSHKVVVGDPYSNDGIHAQSVSDNAIRGANLCVMRQITDMQSPPVEVMLQITHDASENHDKTFMQEDVVDAEFEEAPDSDRTDQASDSTEEQVHSESEGGTASATLEADNEDER